MKKLNKIVLVVALLTITTNTFAQEQNVFFESLLTRLREKVRQLNDDISFMANPKNNPQTRFSYKEDAQTLFINDCKPYSEMLEFKDGTKKTIKRKDGVIMEVVSKRRPIPNPKPMPQYFTGLIKMNYKYVSIATTDIKDMIASKLHKIGTDKDGNNLYRCTVHFEQKFIGTTGDGYKYKDLTRKYVDCYIKEVLVLDESTGERYPEYMARLGDVHVESIEDLFDY